MVIYLMVYVFVRLSSHVLSRRSSIFLFIGVYFFPWVPLSVFSHVCQFAAFINFPVHCETYFRMNTGSYGNITYRFYYCILMGRCNEHITLGIALPLAVCPESYV